MKLVKQFFDVTFLKFIAVGVINTMVGTIVMFAFYNCFQLNYWISSAANYIVGSVVSYFLNRLYTFKYQEKSKKSVLKFVVNISVCYFAAYGIAKPITRFLLSNSSVTIQENGALLIGMGMFVVLNYVGQRYFVFKA